MHEQKGNESRYIISKARFLTVFFASIGNKVFFYYRIVHLKSTGL